MANPVELLLLERVLMLLDNVLEIVVNRTACNDARLRALVHRELVQIEARRRLGDECAIGAASVEELASFRIHLGRIHIDISRKLRFGAIDVQEGEGLAIDGSNSLGSIVHVIRKGRDLVGDTCSWSNSSKRFNNHVLSLAMIQVKQMSASMGSGECDSGVGAATRTSVREPGPKPETCRQNPA